MVGSTFDEIVKFLNDWTTKEQRECGQQLLILHAGALPSDLNLMVEESRRHMSEIMRRLSPQPQPHVNHRMLGAWFADTTRRINDGRARRELVPDRSNTPVSKTTGASGLSQMVTALQEKMFGVVPVLRRTHPLWLDTYDVAAQLSAWRSSGRTRVLWITSRDLFFRSLLSGPPQSPQLFLKGAGSLTGESPLHDACLCELSLSELVNLPALYTNIRQVLCDRGEILIYVHTLDENPLRATPLQLYDDLFPSVDASNVRFRGNSTTALIRKLFFKGTRHFAHRPALRVVMAAVTLLALAPFAWVANTLAARRDANKFNPNWTSAVLHFVVKKKPKIAPEAEIGQIRRESDPNPPAKVTPLSTMA